MKRFSTNKILILGLILFALCLILVIGGGYVFLINLTINDAYNCSPSTSSYIN